MTVLTVYYAASQCSIRRCGLAIATDRVAWSVTVVSPVKTAEPMEMPFGMWTQVGLMKHVLGRVDTGATWRIPLNHPCAAAMRLIVKLLWPLVFISHDVFC